MNLASAPDPLTANVEWGDGLPLMAPDAALVDATLGPTDGTAVIGQVPPSFGEVTARELAEVCVMAGCLPAYYPIVEAALEACLAPEFNLLGVVTTTEMPTPLVMVNGPVRAELGLNSAGNLFGQGHRANATIGRALHLALVRFGGAAPGVGDMATFGHAGKYSYCIAENEECSPWPPFHVDHGLEPTASVVTVVGADAPVNAMCGGQEAEEIATVIAQTMAIPGSNNAVLGGQIVVVVSPDHARAFAAAGWDKADLKEFLFERSKIGDGRYPLTYGRRIRDRRGLAEDADIPVADSRDDVLIFVAGGVGIHSAVIPTFGTTRAAVARIRIK